MTGRSITAAALLMLGVTTHSGQASSQPVPPVALSAGKVRELQLMLSSANLRCNMIGKSLQTNFDHFTQRQDPALAKAELVLKQFFGVKTKADLHAGYDKFQVKILNFYGTGRTDPQSCEEFADVMNMLSEADQEGTLLAKVADIMVVSPIIETVAP